MCVKKQLIAVLTASAVFASPGVFAEDKGSNVDPKAKAEGAQAIAELALANELVKYGDANGDPVALMLGAKIMKNNPTEEKSQKKSTKGEAKADDKAASDSSVAAVLGRAKDLAKDSPELLAMITDVENTSSRALAGRSSSATHTDRVLAGNTDVYELTFLGDRTAAVLVNGDGDTDLDLYIYDENGNEICKDIDATDLMICRWEPRWTGPFTIEIVNLGNVSNVYDMVVQ